MKKILLLGLLGCAASAFAGGGKIAPNLKGAMYAEFMKFIESNYPNPIARNMVVIGTNVYAAGGECLIHRLPEIDAFYMPLSTVGAALLFNHPAVGLGAFRWTEAALLAALTSLLAPFGGLPAAAALAALHFLGGGFMWTRDPTTEAPFALLLLLVAGLMTWRSRRPSLVRTLLLSLAIGVSLMYRSPLAFFPFVLTAFEAITLYRGRRRAHWPHALILCVVPYLFLIPWIRFNWVMKHDVVIFEPHGADNNIAAAALGQSSCIEGEWTSLLSVDKRPATIRLADRGLETAPYKS